MSRQIVGEIFLNVKPLDGGVSQGVQRIIDNASSKAAEVPVTADTEQASRAVNQLSNQITGQLTQSWEQAAGQAAVFTASVLGAKAAVEQTVNRLAGLFDQLAQAQAGFTAILGSEQSGQKLLDDIREFARVSPFVTQELVNYSQQLLGVGQSAESIVPLLRNTGDLIASVGGDTQNISRVLFTLTQIRSIGRLVGQDAIQLQSSLIPITKLLADFLGKTTQEVKKLQEQGAISADTVFAAINAAGEKVEGAMANATRNISGARSVLSDTITNLLQNSTFLRRVFDDIVVGILNFADALSRPEIENNLNRVFESLDRIYTNLQPLLEAIGNTSSQLALDSLKVLAASLEILSGILDSFPEEALTLVGQGLAVLFALKAPLALLNYVNQLRTLGSALADGSVLRSLTRTGAAIEGTGVAAQRASEPVSRLGVAVDRFGGIAAGAAVGIGLFTKSLSEGNEEVNALGDSLIGGGLGAQLGSSFGPTGALVGAVAGAGIGLVTSLINSTREEAERRSQELRDIGAAAADDFLRGFTLTGGIDSESEFTALLREAERFRTNINESLAEADALQATQNRLLNALAVTTSPTPDASVNAALEVDAEETQRQIETIQGSIDRLNGSVETARGNLDRLFADDSEGGKALEALRQRLADLNLEFPEFGERVRSSLELTDDGLFNFTEELQRAQVVLLATGQASVTSVEDFEKLTPVLGGLGLTIEQVLNTPIETLTVLLSDEIPTALKTVKTELDSTKLAFDEAGKAMDAFFGVFATEVNAIKQANEQTNALNSSIAALLDNGITGSEGTQFGSALLSRVESIATASQAVTGDATKAAEEGLSFARTVLIDLQEELGLTTSAFEALLAQMGLLDLFNASTDIDAGFIGSLKDLSRITGQPIEDLREILNLSEEISDSAKLTISADITDALTQLGILQSRLDAFPSDNSTIFSQINALVNEIARVIGLGGGLSVGNARSSVNTGNFDTRGNAQEAEASRIRFRLQQEARDRVAAQQKAEEEARKRAEEEARREAERLQREAERLAEEQRREAERVQNALESAGNTISNAMNNAANSITSAAEQWTASIRERVQEEQAISVSRLISNTGRQSSALEEINRGIETLQARGLSDQAISTIGIDNVSDLRQVRRLLQASPDSLQRLSGLVAQRDTNAEILARRQVQNENKAVIVAAIIDAARILGVDLTTERAIQLAGQIDVSGVTTNGATVPSGLLEALLSEGRILRG